MRTHARPLSLLCTAIFAFSLGCASSAPPQEETYEATPPPALKQETNTVDDTNPEPGEEIDLGMEGSTSGKIVIESGEEPPLASEPEGEGDSEEEPEEDSDKKKEAKKESDPDEGAADDSDDSDKVEVEDESSELDL